MQDLDSRIATALRLSITDSIIYSPAMIDSHETYYSSPRQLPRNTPNVHERKQCHDEVPKLLFLPTDRPDHMHQKLSMLCTFLDPAYLSPRILFLGLLLDLRAFLSIFVSFGCFWVNDRGFCHGGVLTWSC